ncbi:hypothetical protein [Pseudomonas sp. A-RE-23]|uniref:hypothetical protein n=1 Tax=Pseudomonas sp. A-RE-23 TaxID=2832376 RepID=UPI001CBC968A|nr:hypothetical protein [Pseudomonas sp. A-RE-23]
MTDYTELKRLAEAMKGWDRLTECWSCGENGPDWQVGQVDEDDNRYPVMTIDTEQYDAETDAPTLAQFYAAANPAAILALISDGERLRMQLVACGVVASSNTRETAERQRDMHPDYMSASCQEVIRAVDREMDLREERDQLRAEVAGLKTGYQAHERVNAELKVEVEGLRKALTYIRDTSDDWHVCENAADALSDAAMGKGEQS